MKLERSKNAKRNGFWGMVSNVYSILFAFIVRTAMIKEMGAEYLGLSSLFTSVLTILNITELGFGTAIVYSMYKPLAADDISMLCALLNFFKKIYRTIGGIILLVGICLLPFLNKLVMGDIPYDINMYVIYILYLLNTTASYWLLAYKNSILTIYQRNDIKSKLTIILSTCMYMAQIILIIATKNYYFYVLALVLYTMLSNIVPAIYVKKTYPQYICYGTIPDEKKRDIKAKVTGLMITKISSVSRNAFDSVIVSVFLGLAMVAVYNNYYYFINALTGILLVFTTAMSAGIGNSVAVETKDKNLIDMRIINFLYMWIAGWFTTCLACIYQPFMRLWVGEKLMLPKGTMFLFAIYFLFLKVGDIQALYFDAAGLWWHKRWYSAAEAIANIVLNILLGYYFGIAGIVIATILTIFLINFLGSSRVIFKEYFKRSYKKYIMEQSKYIIVTIIVTVTTMIFCCVIPYAPTTVKGLIMLIGIRGVICTVFSNFLFWILYRHSSIYGLAVPWIKARLGR